MQAVLFESLSLPSLLTDEVAGGICQLQRALQGAGLFGGWQKFHLGYQFHRPQCSTNVLHLQVSKLCLLRLFDVAFDILGAHMPGCPDIVAFRSQPCVFALILAAQISKLLFEPLGCDALEVMHNLSGREFGRGRHEPMHMMVR